MPTFGDICYVVYNIGKGDNMNELRDRLNRIAEALEGKLSKKEQKLLVSEYKRVEAELAKSNYYEYVKYTHSEIYTYTRHGEFICNTINDAINKREAMLNGEIPIETQYLMYTVPAQHGKSMHITETLPSYFFGKFPQHGCIEISYNEDFATKFGKRNREKVEMCGKELFDISIPSDNRASSEWGIASKGKTTRGGMISRGIMSGITGSSLGDLVIMDDVVKNRKEANSETTRKSHWDEWTDSISKRIHPGAIVILIMTRWHEDDLAGRLLNAEYGEVLPWIVHNLPIECDEKHIEEEGNPLNRELGEPLWPEVYGYSEIAKRKQYKHTFSAMDQGRPTAEGGNIFKRESWQYYDYSKEFVDTLPVLVMSVDASFTDTSDSAKVSIQIWGKLGANAYQVDNYTHRLNFTATVQAIRNMIQKYPRIGGKYIEAKANGHAIINVLNKDIGGFIPVKADVSTGGKVARAYAVESFVTAGNVWLPRGDGCEWVHGYVEEMSSFPNGTYKDQVDSTTQILNKLYFFYAEVEKEQMLPSQFNFVEKKPTNPYTVEYSNDYINQF